MSYDISFDVSTARIDSRTISKFEKIGVGIAPAASLGYPALIPGRVSRIRTYVPMPIPAGPAPHVYFGLYKPKARISSANNSLYVKLNECSRLSALTR